MCSATTNVAGLCVSGRCAGDTNRQERRPFPPPTRVEAATPAPILGKVANALASRRRTANLFRSPIGLRKPSLEAGSMINVATDARRPINRSTVKKFRKSVRCQFGGGGLGVSLGDGVEPRLSVNGQYRPRTRAILAAQLDVQARAVMLDAKPVCLVPVFVQDPSAIRVGHERRPSAARHLIR